jgi:hypothetical protein
MNRIGSYQVDEINKNLSDVNVLRHVMKTYFFFVKISIRFVGL